MRSKAQTCWLALGAAVMMIAMATNAEPKEKKAQAPAWQKRWVRVALNMIRPENVRRGEELIDRAAKAGYNGIVFADYKLNTWWDPAVGVGDAWRKNMLSLRKKTHQRGLEFWASVVSIGYSGGILCHDPNLATGYPIRKAKLRAQGGRLLPIDEVRIANPSFENYKGNKFDGWTHDDPGKGSFVDTKIAKDGKASIRFECGARSNKWGHNRINQVLDVRPFQQYRLRYWVKLENVTGYYQTLVMSGKRTLQVCGYRVKAEELGPIRSSLRNTTADWAEQIVTFNSLNFDKVRIYAGVWGGKTGRMWIDDFQIEAVPTLNVLRRADLPLRIVGADGTEYIEGKDFERVVDPKLGHARWTGTFGVVHEPPIIKLTRNSRIREGQEVFLSCHHALPMPNDQVNCSLYNPKVFEIVRQIVRHNEELLHPDGWFLSYDEMRTGGWEPEETKHFKTSGELLAYNIKRVTDIVRQEGGNKPMCVWSDMFDPHHNAHENYYMVNNTLAGSWEGLPKDMIILTWIAQRKSVEFFAKHGYKQIVGGYYDGDVVKNHENWIKATTGVPAVIGTMFCTWVNDWSNLEKYADVWWGQEPQGR